MVKVPFDWILHPAGYSKLMRFAVLLVYTSGGAFDVTLDRGMTLFTGVKVRMQHLRIHL